MQLRLTRICSFSLRSLLFALTCLTVALAAFGHEFRRARQTEAAVAALRGAGCDVGYDWQTTIYVRRGLTSCFGGATARKYCGTLECWPQWRLGQIFGDGFRAHALTVEAEGQTLDVTWVGALRDLPELELLSIKHCDASKLDWSQLPRLSRLRYLVLDDCHLNSSTSALLQKCPNVEMLYITNDTLDDRAMRQIQELPKLRLLTLEHMQLPPDALDHVANVRQLEELALDNTAVNAAAQSLTRLKHLRLLWLRKTDVTESRIRQLWNAMPDLEQIDVAGTSIKSYDPFWYEVVQRGGENPPFLSLPD